MNTLKTIFITLILFGCLHVTNAQEAIPAPMKPLEVLLGEWDGDGSQSRGPNDMVTFNHHEVVSTELDGRLFVFHGTGTKTGESDPTFKAYGVMTYEAEADQVYIHAWTMSGEYTKAPVEISDDSFTWSFDVPNGGKVRYMASFSKNKWTERGEYSPDKGETWYQFMDTNLSR